MASDIERAETPKDAVLILGAGLAGLFAAIKLAPRKAVVLTPGSVRRGATSAWAQGGLAAPLGPGDSIAAHLADTIAAGDGLVDDAAARLMIEDGPARIDDLVAMGVAFDRNADGSFALGREAAHSDARIVHAKGDQAGAAIMDRVIDAAYASPHVDIREGYAAEEILAADGRVAGVLAVDVARARRVIFPANDVVLATGGMGGLYAVTTNPKRAQGHGLAMAARAGAEILDPEFVQFHPTAIDIGQDPAPLATEALRGEGAILVNRDGRRFMQDLHPSAELGPRDLVARAVAAEIAAGRGAFLDTRETVGARIATDYKTVYDACMSSGLDPAREPIPVAPAAHYHMGGVKTDVDGRTSLDGLWACGEAAGVGVHGANRLASNSLLETVVFGQRVADAARDAPPRAALALTPPVPADRLRMAAKPAPDEAIAPLRRLMTANVGLLRAAEGLRAALAEIARMEADDAMTSGMANALTTARIIAAAALAREESRGGHYRLDYPIKSPAFARHTVITLANAETSFQLDEEHA